MVRRNDVQQRLDAELVDKAKQVAALRKINAAEYLSELLKPLVERDLREELRKALEGLPDEEQLASRPARRRRRKADG